MRPDSATNTEQGKLANERGYSLPYHRALVHHDPDVMSAANGLVRATYLDARTLPKQTKELLFVVSLGALRAPKDHIVAHIRAGVREGLTGAEILEALEILIPEAGVVTFGNAVEAWMEVFDQEEDPASPQTQ